MKAEVRLLTKVGRAQRREVTSPASRTRPLVRILGARVLRKRLDRYGTTVSEAPVSCSAGKSADSQAADGGADPSLRIEPTARTDNPGRRAGLCTTIIPCHGIGLAIMPHA